MGCFYRLTRVKTLPWQKIIAYMDTNTVLVLLICIYKYMYNEYKFTKFLSLESHLAKIVYYLSFKIIRAV